MNFLSKYSRSQTIKSLFHRVENNKQTYFMDIKVTITELSNNVVKVLVN